MVHTASNVLRLGVDVGSTTVKAVITDPGTNQVLFTRYQRHNAHQAATVRQLLKEAAGRFPDIRFRVGVCGSGGRPIAAALGAHYIQEVVANAAAIRVLYPNVRTAVELGGQDAKVIFFHYDEASGRLQTSDMRMNGSCAGGTGAFIDEIAALLNVPADEFEKLAAAGKTVYSISGRCGVFAKTDIQPLLIQGAERADIALSTFHAIAKQTIGGLSQGLELTAPIIFEGGPLTFNPTLVRVFAERLGLEQGDIVRPEHPETIVARGTAIAVDELFPGEQDAMTLSQALERLDAAPAQPQEAAGTGKPYFADENEKNAFLRRHQAELRQPVDATDRKVLRGYLGIDSGSTTSKFVLMDENEQVTDTFYANNQGEPLRVVRQGLLALAEKYRKLGDSTGNPGPGHHRLRRADALRGLPRRLPHGGDRGPRPGLPPLLPGCHLPAGYRRPGHEGHLAQGRRGHQHHAERGMLLRLRLLPGEFRRHAGHAGGPGGRGRLPLPDPCGAGQPVHSVHEQHHHQRAAQRQAARRPDGGALPVHHRKRLYQGGADRQRLGAGGQGGGPGRHLPQLRRAAGPGGVPGPGGDPGPVPR